MAKANHRSKEDWLSSLHPNSALQNSSAKISMEGGMWGFPKQPFIDVRGSALLLYASETEDELEQKWEKIKGEILESWRSRGRELIFIIHDDRMSIDDDDVVEALSIVNKAGKRTPIDIILHTHGGHVSQTETIAGAIVKRKRTAAYIPFYAHSGGTLVALATERIYLGKAAALGPLDLQIAGWRASDLIALAKKLGDEAPPDLILLAKEAERALEEHTEKVCTLINKYHKGFLGLRRCALARELTTGDMHHSEAIGYKRAAKLGMNVTESMPKDVLEIVTIRYQQLKKLREIRDSKKRSTG